MSRGIPEQRRNLLGAALHGVDEKRICMRIPAGCGRAATPAHAVSRVPEHLLGYIDSHVRQRFLLPRLALDDLRLIANLIGTRG